MTRKRQATVQASGHVKKSDKILKLLRTFKAFTTILGRLMFVTIFICSYEYALHYRSFPITVCDLFGHMYIVIVVVGQ